MNLEKVDSLHLSTTQGPCEIQLLLGDITKLSMQDKVDLLIVSAFPCDYTVASKSLIKSLHVNMGLSVANLSRDKYLDLRKYYSCWLSKPLPSDMPFSRIACFEKRLTGMHPIEQIKDMFRGFMPIFNSQDTTVITPLLGTGCQNYDEIYVLTTIVEAACNWMRVGLPLRCLKIVLYEKDSRKASAINEKCIEQFAELKRKWELPLAFKILKKNYDVYISYSPSDVDIAEMLVANFGTSNKKINIFSKRIKKNENKVWPEHIISAMYGCKRVLVILTSSYLETKDCLDEFNIAICYKREAEQLKLVPLCIETLENLSPVISNVQYMDCRLNKGETLIEKLVSVCERIQNELSVLQSSKQFISSVTMKKFTYDIFVSYPTKHGDKMKVVYEILRKHNPNLNIFYDKLELQTGSNWQQSIYDALEVTTFCLILVAPAYFESAMCQEEFNIVLARCLSEDQENRVLLIPLYIVDVECVPDWFGQLNIIDARENLLVPSMEKLALQLNSSFQNKSLWNDFDWLITEEVKNRISVRNVTMQYRRQLFTDIYQTEKDTIVRTPPLDKSKDPCSMLFCFAPSDMKFAASLVKHLLEYLPLMKVVLFETSHQNRLSLLDTTDYIVMFVSPEYLSTAKALEELTICFNRQRRTKQRILYFACTAEIPECMSYLQILPYSIVLTDSHWIDMKTKYPDQKIFSFALEEIHGTFTYESYEIAAMNKFALDILSSVVESENPINDVGNLLNIFKIQKKHQQVPLHECLVSWPGNYEENLILEETRNKDSDETLEDTKESDVYVASGSDECKSNEAGNNETQTENDTDKEVVDNESCGDERPTLTDKNPLNVSEEKDDIGKNSPEETKASVSNREASSDEAAAFGNNNSEKQTNCSTNEDIERLPSPKPGVSVEIGSISNETKDKCTDEDVAKKDGASDVEKEKTVEDSLPENLVSSTGNERQEDSNESKNDSTERENRKDQDKVRPRRNDANKASICKLL